MGYLRVDNLVVVGNMMGANGKLSSIVFLYALLLLCSSHHLFSYATARDTLTDGNHIRDDGSEGLVSAGGKFELGFFTPTPATFQREEDRRRYVCIWYHKLSPKTCVWVANRKKALLFNSTGILIAIKQGNLQVWDNVTGNSYWSTELGQTSSSLKTVKLMDSGNLVLTDDKGGILWQSFQNPTDTFIPGMVMDKSLELISWREKDDPRIGNFHFKLDQEGDNKFIILNKSIPYWKDGVPGEFMSSTEMPSFITYLLSNFSKSTSGRATTSPGKGKLNPYNSTIPQSWDYSYTRLVMNYTGKLQVLVWIEDEKQWFYYWSEPRDRCSVFKACGNFGSCNGNNEPLVCKCLPGFKPRDVEKWDSGEFSAGCVRESQMRGKKDIFLSLKMMKVEKPDSSFRVNSETECRNECLNSDWVAYSYTAVKTSSRRDYHADLPMCWTWSDLNNLEEEYSEGGHNLSVRVPSSDLESTVRNCEPCGTTMIPYPLSTRLDCGDPMYFRFNCEASTGQVSFVGLNNETYRVIGISPNTQRFFIQAKNVDNCDPTNKLKVQQLNPSLPFKVTNWCRADLRNFNFDLVSSGGSNVVEMGWEPPLEPTCTKSADCRDWPHSTCNPAKKRCLCNTNFKWNDLNCTQEGIQESLKPPLEEHSRRKMPLSLIVVAVVICVFFLACIVAIYIWRRKMTKKRDQISRGQFDSERRVKELIDTSEFKKQDDKGIDVPFFDLQSILDATDNFSDANKLGQGGYGPVYKGKFLGGQEIAVKRLSRVSGQGLQEFKNEVVLIAKLQHRNLVRLRGYCMRGEEKILLYEYMPNKSLDSFIFDRSKSVFLNWEMRFNIILGIARGLLYLHQDSRLRIIHRDLKTSNILLDEEMNPKISDFGLARIVGGKETEANTNTVVGTYGYMSPEYALDGTFSVKSDVFSFGVVLLEIISGRKNTAFYQSKQTFSLLSNTWRLWTEDKVLDFMDMTLHESCDKSQFIKCVNVGLLCVQEDPSDRPTMSNVITMLDSETSIPPVPKEPAFAVRRGNSSTASSSSKPSETHAEITVTLEEGR